MMVEGEQKVRGEVKRKKRKPIKNDGILKENVKTRKIGTKIF